MDKDEMKFKEAYSNLGQFSKAAKIKCFLILIF